MIEALDQRLDQGIHQAGVVLAATVQALSEDAGDEASDLRAQLPRPLADVEAAGPARRQSLDEFVIRVGELSGAEDAEQARRYTEAGFDIISAAISPGQLRQLLQALPDDYADLAPRISGLTGHEETLLAEIRQEAKLHTVEQARQLTSAVLSVLAGALSGGQATRLAHALPPDIGASLHVSEKAEHTDTERFLHDIADRSTVTTHDTVREHTAAVLTVLRAGAPDKLAKALDQLPHSITELAR